MAQLNEEIIFLHEKLHDPKKPTAFQYKSRYYVVKKAKNGCRYLAYKGFLLMAQNPNTDSDFAARARNGEAISWYMHGRPWLLVDQKAIERYSLLQTG